MRLQFWAVVAAGAAGTVSGVAVDGGVGPRARGRQHAARGATRQYGAIGRRTTRHAVVRRESAQEQARRKVFGWVKTVGGLRQVKHRGGRLVDWQVTFASAAYDLVRGRSARPSPEAT